MTQNGFKMKVEPEAKGKLIGQLKFLNPVYGQNFQKKLWVFLPDFETFISVYVVVYGAIFWFSLQNRKF